MMPGYLLLMQLGNMLYVKEKLVMIEASEVCPPLQEIL
jgi:hypothetical protein